LFDLNLKFDNFVMTGLDRVSNAVILQKKKLREIAEKFCKMSCQ